MIKTLKCTDLKGESHNFFYQSNLIFRIVMWCGIVSFGQRSLKHPKLEILVPDFVPRYLEWSKWLNNIICKYSKPFLQTGDVSETFNILMTKSDSGPNVKEQQEQSTLLCLLLRLICGSDQMSTESTLFWILNGELKA